jgi:hypothetical protein
LTEIASARIQWAKSLDFVLALPIKSSQAKQCLAFSIGAPGQFPEHKVDEAEKVKYWHC